MKLKISINTNHDYVIEMGESENMINKKPYQYQLNTLLMIEV
jgi:hypothetical protein